MFNKSAASDAVPVPIIRNALAKALVADDDPAISVMVQRILRTEGYDVTIVKDGEEATTALKGGTFDLVITDIEMPRVGGLELLERLRVIAPNTPVIFVTGNPTVDSAMAVMNDEVVGYLPKPFTPEQVIEAVNRARRASKLQLAASSQSPASLRSQQARKAAVTFEAAMRELFMFYQPIVRWSTRSVYSYEALMRTSHSDVPHPGVFLELAEGLGRVAELGQTVRDTIAEQVRLGVPKGTHVFVNLHPEELLDEALYNPDSALAQQADQVVLEITERESLQGLPDAPERIARLRKMGFRIAIDDIGAGYSSLNSFVDMEPDLVKIDMGLVRGIDTCKRRQKLVRSLLALAKELEIDVVAEGVETAAERDTLIRMGCDLLQGYLFARPGKPFPEAQLADA